MQPLIIPIVDCLSFVIIAATHRKMVNLTVLREECSRKARSISWLLMPWLLVSPGHQQPFYWWYRSNRSLSFMLRNANHLQHCSLEHAINLGFFKTVWYIRGYRNFWVMWWLTEFSDASMSENHSWITSLITGQKSIFTVSHTSSDFLHALLCFIYILYTCFTGNSCLGSTAKKTSEPPITVPLWSKSTGEQWIPLTKGQ